MSNLIFINFFEKSNSIFTLLESLYIYGNIDNNKQILINTTLELSDFIKKSNLYNDNIIIHIVENSNIKNKNYGLLNLFKFNFKKFNYDKIIYLNYNSVVKNDLTPLFNFNYKDNFIYSINDNTFNVCDNVDCDNVDCDNIDCVNNENIVINFANDESSAFPDDIVVPDDNDVHDDNNENIVVDFVYENVVDVENAKNNENDEDECKDANFLQYILIFNNSNEIKTIFMNFINNYEYEFIKDFEDYVNKYFVKNKLILCPEFLNNHIKIVYKPETKDNIFEFDCNPKILCFFKVKDDSKYNVKYFFKLKDNTINSIILRTKRFIDNELVPIIKSTKEPLEGNIFMKHLTFEYTNEFLNKQKNLCSLALNKNIKNVLEIGFNSGFSSLLLLLSNENLKLTCVDLGEHKYTKLCFNKLKEIFTNRIQFIEGNSNILLPELIENGNFYDMIHIDGGHQQEVARQDIINSYKLSKNNTILIMDDYDAPVLHRLWDDFLENFNTKTLDIYIYYTMSHDIKMILK